MSEHSFEVSCFNNTALSGTHQNFVASKREAEQDYVKKALSSGQNGASPSKQALSLESLEATISTVYASKNLKTALRLLLLLLLKVDALLEGADKTARVLKIIAFIKDSGHLKTLPKLLNELLSQLSEVERVQPLKECEAILGVLLSWTTRPDVEPHLETLQQKIITPVGHYLIGDQADLPGCLETPKPISEALKYCIQTAVRLKAGFNLTNQELSLLKGSNQKMLLSYPQSQRIRSLYNSLQLHLRIFDGLVLLKDVDGKVLPTEFGSDRRFQELFRQVEVTQPENALSAKTNPLKLAILQNPDRRFSQEALKHLNSIRPKTKAPATKPPTPTGDELYRYCCRQKNSILSRQFGQKSDGKLLFITETANLFVNTLSIWKKGGHSDVSKHRAIKLLAAVDNLLLLSLICYPPSTLKDADLEAQTSKAAQMVDLCDPGSGQHSH